MKQELATSHQQLGLIQVLDGHFIPAIEDLYQPLKISIEASRCGIQCRWNIPIPMKVQKHFQQSIAAAL